MRQKIDFGIDLGTTNSAIAKMESGELLIVKSDFQMDTTPSCVSFNKKKTTFVGMTAANLISKEKIESFKNNKADSANGYAEFKRTMGTDQSYYSSNMDKNFTSEDLSSEVLKKLRDYESAEKTSTAVITVPAMFKQSQLDATQRAAELAGFQYCELLQEPIAASIAYGIKTAQENGYWLVFDFGGGTFDAALMHVEEGIMKVIDTEGDNHLGGKDIDNAIVDHLIIPKIVHQCDLSETMRNPQHVDLLRQAVKTHAEQAKIALSSKQDWNYYLEDLGEDDDGEEIEADIEISLNEYEIVCEPIFQKAIDIVSNVLSRNRLNKSDLQTLILVGGPTFSQTLRRMLKEQITNNVDTSIDPMTAVAKGAAMFAATRDIPLSLQTRDTSKAQLSLKYSDTTVEQYVNLGIRIDRDKSSANLPVTFSLEVVRGDNAWTSGKITIEDDAELLELMLNEGKSNLFTLRLSAPDGTAIPCEPANLTIISGLKIANATLPYAIGLERFDSEHESEGVSPIPGLEKNSTLPAKGTIKLKTSKTIRPGNRQDRLIIPVFEIASGFENDFSRAILNNFHSKVIITGDDFPSLLPEGSDVEVMLNIDASRRTKVSVYIPAFDESFDFVVESRIEEELDAAGLHQQLKEARNSALLLSEDGNAEAEQQISILDDAEDLLESRGQERDTKEQVKDKIQKAFLTLDKHSKKNPWTLAQGELQRELQKLAEQQQLNGSQEGQAALRRFQQEAQRIIAKEDTKSAKNLAKDISDTHIQLEMQDIRFWVGFVYYLDEEFENITWLDKQAAWQGIQQLKQLLDVNPELQRLKTAVQSVMQLMQNESRSALNGRFNTTLLHK